MLAHMRIRDFVWEIIVSIRRASWSLWKYYSHVHTIFFSFDKFSSNTYYVSMVTFTPIIWHSKNFKIYLKGGTKNYAFVMVGVVTLNTGLMLPNRRGWQNIPIQWVFNLRQSEWVGFGSLFFFNWVRFEFAKLKLALGRVRVQVKNLFDLTHSEYSICLPLISL